MTNLAGRLCVRRISLSPYLGRHHRHFHRHAPATVRAQDHLLQQHQFVPTHSPAAAEDPDVLERLGDLVRGNGDLLVLTGAGISTESGIPDYRSEKVGLYATSDKRPIQHKAFMDSAAARRSYWARNFVGWPRWSKFEPNEAHRALYRWERLGLTSALITQNVDQLHYKAGSSEVVELHGTNSTVMCMNCSHQQTRFSFQQVLRDANPDFFEANMDAHEWAASVMNAITRDTIQLIITRY